jgi:hypothetical protein
MTLEEHEPKEVECIQCYIDAGSEYCLKTCNMLPHTENESYGGCVEGEFPSINGVLVETIDLGVTRERRDNPVRISDLKRVVDKRIEAFPTSGLELLGGQTMAPAHDKNTPSALKTLRWSIYEVIERYEADYGKTISGCLKQEVERLFQEYTNS